MKPSFGIAAPLSAPASTDAPRDEVKAVHDAARAHDDPDEDPCDMCGQPTVVWRKCKLICRSCGAILKSCADL